MDIVWKRLDEITPYENNPRDNDQAVDAVASSIKEFGFKVPIVIDAQGVIVAGHTRHKAAKKLGLEKVPCIVADDLSDEQIRAFRLADNKTAELADWNEDLLAQELAEIEDIDMTLFGFGDEESDLADELEDNPYTMATNVPQYEPTGAKPSLSQLYDADKTDDLIAEIEASGLSKEEKGFLDASGAATVAFAQGGDFIGGLRGGNFKKRLLRKAMNSFFCRVDRPIQFRGTMNEDVTTYTTLGSRGELFFTFVDVHIIQIPTQSLGGGMTAAYRESGTYLKTFYSVMSMPSCIKVGMMYSKNSRIHHRIDWECCVPKILNEKYRKER